jgi:dipeptidyl aminopeptidase/acylaminoacyl peptidase
MGEHDDVMGRSYADITAGVDALVARGIADPERIGIGGYSWGGLAAAWGATFDSSRYNAAYVGGGISNWLSHSGTSVTARHDQLTHWNRMLYADNYHLFLERSPIAQVANAKTPTLILHSEDDMDVPVGQAYELYSALQWKKVPSELVIYPDEGHIPQTEAHRIDSLTRIRAWFLKYLIQ